MSEICSEYTLDHLRLRIPCNASASIRCEICGKALCAKHCYQMGNTFVCIDHISNEQKKDEPMEEYSPRKFCEELLKRGVALSYTTVATKCHEGLMAHRKVRRLYSDRYRILIPASEIEKVVAFYQEEIHDESDSTRNP